jgi:hypothetical protein
MRAAFLPSTEDSMNRIGWLAAAGLFLSAAACSGASSTNGGPDLTGSSVDRGQVGTHAHQGDRDGDVDDDDDRDGAAEHEDAEQEHGNPGHEDAAGEHGDAEAEHEHEDAEAEHEDAAGEHGDRADADVEHGGSGPH